MSEYNGTAIFWLVATIIMSVCYVIRGIQISELKEEVEELKRNRKIIISLKDIIKGEKR